MRVAVCGGGYGSLPAFSMSAFARWFAVHPVQAFVWLYAHRLSWFRLRACPAMPWVAPALAFTAAAALPAVAPPRDFWVVSLYLAIGKSTLGMLIKIRTD